MSDDATLVRCPLCGRTFPARDSCPDGCPLAASCRSLCCPYCAYRFVQDSTVARLIRRVVPARWL